MYANKFESLDEIVKFPENQNFKTDRRNKNMNAPITIDEI